MKMPNLNSRRVQAMYPGFEEYERLKAQARLGLKPWLKWEKIKMNTFGISKTLLTNKHFQLKHEIKQRQISIDDLNHKLKETLEAQAKLIKEAEDVMNEMNNLPGSEK